MKKKILLVTGDPNSINSEIIFKTWKKINKSLKKRIYLISNYDLLFKQFKKQNGNGNKPEKRRGKRLTAREKRDLNLYKVKKDTLKFQSFKKLPKYF